jgi:hypothetical protein
LLAVFTISFVVYGLSPVRQNFDSYLAFPTAQSVVHDTNLSLNEFNSPMFDDHGWMTITPEGREVNTYPWVPSLMLIPAVIALDVAHLIGIGPGSSSVANGGHMDVIQQLSASAVVALIVVLVFVISFQRLNESLSLRRRRAVAGVVAFGFAFGTAAWSTASRAMWQHGPSLLFLAIAVYCCQQLLSKTAVEGRKLRWTAVCLGAAVAASFTCRPTDALAVLGFTAFVAFRLRRHLKRFLIGAFAIAVPWVMINKATYGAVLPSYYRAGKVGLHHDYALALATNLVSPARGLLLFSPIVLLGVFGIVQRNRADIKDGLLEFDRMLIALCVGYLLASSGPSENWWGGHSFGPRFMSDTLVFFAAAATPTVALLMRQRRSAAAIAATLLLAWSVLVNAQGGAMRSTLCWNGNPNIDTHTSRLWDFGSSQMLSGVQAAFHDGVVDAIFTRCDTVAD